MTLAERAAEMLAGIDPDARMDAYYFSFDRTGVAPIDAVLSEVAIAGKRYHHTEMWNDGSSWGTDGEPTMQDRIQKVAQEAATAVRTLIEDLVADIRARDGAVARELEAVAAKERAEADVERLLDSGTPFCACDTCVRLHDEAVAAR